ncbi:hypothetical protein AAHC03_024500 [Spirometra sp. Aus1]
MSKSRIEGLIATFTKLIDSSKQHTFIETESVRYVYQPLERMYVLLITTKASNILEDLETLRLFARVIPEYARGSETSDVVENAFQLMFAFDEIVALGYRETVTLAQIRTYTEMDSHEERMFIAVRENQEKEAKDTMRKRARELQQARIAAAKQGISPAAALSNFTSGRSGYDPIPVQPTLDPRIDESISTPQDNFSSQQQQPSVRRGMRLGGRSGKGEMDKLAGMLGVERPAATTTATSDTAPLLSDAPGLSVEQGPIENLHVMIEEKLTVQAGRDGGLELMELAGVMMVRVGDESVRDSRILVDTQAAVAGTDRRPSASMQTHPNLDKKAFQAEGWLQTKPGGKSFPVGQEVGVLKWRLQTQDDACMPILINCWPNEIPGGFEVNIEYELQDTSLSLMNFLVKIPLPPGSKPPLVGSCDGDYEVDLRHSQLLWTRPLVDGDNATGSLEFTVKAERGAKADLFFPINVDFSSKASFCGIQVVKALDANSNPVKFSTEANFHPDRYEIA